MRRPLLLPLVPLYAAGLAWKSRAFDRHPERARQLRDPVISVGSLSSGGAGKTPFVIALGEALRRAGCAIDVLSRGYGRTSAGSLRVHPHGTAEEFGDEPLLIARTLACPVYVSAERFRAGQMAETDRRVTRTGRTQAVHLLDDGFQHRQLARAADIVLLTAKDLHDTLLPAGNLREPPHALRRASILVLRHDEAEALRPAIQQVLPATSMPVIWIIERRAAIVEGTCPARPLAFCGTARPESFRASLKDLDIAPAGFLPLRDHQQYGSALIANLLSAATRAQAGGFVTTAKDAVKLTPAMRQTLAGAGPLAVCDLQVHIQDEQRCIADLRAMLRAGQQRL